MKRLLQTLAVLGMLTVVPAAARADLGVGIENPNFNDIIPGTGIRVASDGEQSFDPFGFNADTSDGIQFPAPAQLLSGDFWTPLDAVAPGVASTWVLPANLGSLGSENEPTAEPLGVWFLPNYAGPLGVFTILQDPTSTDISDVINIIPTEGGAIVTFQSDPAVPEPGRVAALLGMGGMGLVGLVWRRRKQA